MEFADQIASRITAGVDHGRESTAAGGPLERLHVGVLGAGSFVAPRLLARLERAGYVPRPVTFRDGASPTVGDEPLAAAVALCPLWGLVDRLSWLAARGVRRLVAVSSTSRFTKASSPDPAERAVAERLASAEDAVGRWAEKHGARITILRPTLVYDGIHDRNVTAIATFIRRWGVFPLINGAHGLRQPLHADDLAAACVAALDAPAPRASYDIAGGETLTYHEMVRRIFAAVGRSPRFLHVPRGVVRFMLPVLALVPGFRGVSLAAFDRMNEPLVVDHAAATRDLGFAPRAFEPSAWGS